MNQIKNCPTCRQSELSAIHIVNCAPDPLDPPKVHVGDTVTLTRKMSTAVGPVTRIDRSDSKGIGFHIDGYPYPLWTQVHPRWTLTDHQPAPEPEPEWKPGTVAVVSYPKYMGDGDTLDARAVLGSNGWHPFEDPTDIITADEVTDVRPLVVVDPAAVDVDALVRAVEDSPRAQGWRYVVVSLLAELGIEAS